MKIVTHFAFNSNKTPLRQYSLRRPFAQDFRGTGGWGGGMAMEFQWAWNIFKNFLINLCKGRVILEGINIF